MEARDRLDIPETVVPEPPSDLKPVMRSVTKHEPVSVSKTGLPSASVRPVPLEQMVPAPPVLDADESETEKAPELKEAPKVSLLPANAQPLLVPAESPQELAAGIVESKVVEPNLAAPKLTEPAPKLTEPAPKLTEPTPKLTEPAPKLTEPELAKPEPQTDTALKNQPTDEDKSVESKPTATTLKLAAKPMQAAPIPVTPPPVVQPIQKAAPLQVAKPQANAKPVVRPAAPMPEPVVLQAPEQKQRVVAKQEPVVKEPVVQVNPILFSMSDNNKAAVANPAEELQKAPKPQEPSSIGLSVLDKPEPEQLKPIGSVQAAKRILLQKPKATTDTMLSSKSRFRPPVAVAAPPIAIQRGGLIPPVHTDSEQPVAEVKSSIPAVVKAAPAVLKADPAPQAVTTTAKHNLTKLTMTKAEVRSLTIGGHVRRVSVSDTSVCQAFASGPSQLKLIGVGSGVTRLVVWADPTSKSHTHTRAFEIHVQESSARVAGSMENKVPVLNRSIANSFPNANVRVQQMGDHLVVVGTCSDDSSAKKIVRLVRKACLIPVRDEIKVR